MKKLDDSSCPNREACLIYHCLYADPSVQSLLQLIEFEKGETLYQHGSPASGCYVLCRGRIKLLRSTPSGKRFLISILNCADLLGEESFFHGSYLGCAKAMERSLVIFIAREKLTTLLMRHPHLAMWLATVLSRRCKALYGRIVETSWNSARERLAALLLRLEQSNGSLTKLSQADLAELLGMARATVNEHLRGLERAGLIALAHRKVSLLNREGLLKLVQAPVRASAKKPAPPT